MTTTKEDRSFKTLINKRVTSSAKQFYEEIGDETLVITSDQLWAEDVEINDPTQAITDGAVEFRSKFALTEDVTVANQQSWYADDSGRLKDWVSDRFGSAYTTKLFDNSDNEIFPTDALDWFFDYPTGILTVSGNAGAFSQPFKLDGYRYIGQKGISNPTDGYNDYTIVATISERDAIPAIELKTGVRVNVQSLPYVYEYDGYSSSWNVVERGNMAIVSEVSPTTLLIRHLDSISGNNEGDGLTSGTAWKTAQRCVDEFAGQPFNSGGNIQVRCVGICNEPHPSYGSLIDGAQTVYFDWVGDTEVAVDETFTMPTADPQPLNPNDPNGGNLFGFKQHTITPWSTVIDEDLYWLEGIDTTLGSDRLNGYNVLDESSEGDGYLRVSGAIDRSLTYSTMRLRTRLTRFVRNGVSGASVATNPNNRWNIRFIGFIFDGNKLHAQGPIAVQACFFSQEYRKTGNDAWLPQDSVHGSTASFIQGLNHGEDNIGGGAYISGIFQNAFDIWEGWWRVYGITVRSRMRVGAGGRAASNTAIHLDFADFAPNNNLDCMVLSNAEVQIGTSSGDVSIASPRRRIATLSRQSMLRVSGSRVWGATDHADGSFDVNDGGRVFGIGALTGQVTNEGSGGEVDVGAITVSFADLPVTDLDSLSRAEV